MLGSMAGRSGAAAIEVALGEAAASFDAAALATQLRSSSVRDAQALASALEAVQGRPAVQTRDGECYLEFVAIAEDAEVRRADVSAAYTGGSLGHGVEVLLVGSSVVGVSLYLE